MPGKVTVRFYAELNRYLAPSTRYACMEVPVESGSKIGAFLERTGVPASEVDLVLCNGETAGFDEPVCPGDRLSVYPVFETFDVSSVQRLRPHPLRSPAYILDVHLGRLASFLRLLGFDAAFASTLTDEELVAISLKEGRTLLSRDRALVRDPRLERAALIKAGDPQDQLLEVVGRFQLEGTSRPFTRCLRCNSLLEQVRKDLILDRLPPRVRETQEEFTACPTCQRVYWKGTHHAHMTAFVTAITDRSATPPEQTA